MSAVQPGKIPKRGCALLCALLLMLGGCQQSPPEPAPMTRALPADTWFCAPDPESGETPWKCIETTPIEAARQARSTPPAEPPRAAPSAQPASRPERDSAQSEDTPARAATPPDAPKAETEPAEAPRVRIEDLPPDYYTIQLVAVSDRERLQKFAEMHDLWGLTAARVKTDRGLYYVLLWGVYETREQARAYLQKLPPTLDPDKVWIRPLGSLQAAMRAAEAFTGTPQ